jgi:outer membrane protein assembly factor BamB
VLSEIDDKRTDIVIAVPFEIWGVDPSSGKLSWFCEALSSRNFCSSVIIDDKTVYAVGEQGSGSIAVAAGGKDDVTKSNIVWKGRDGGRVSTPLIADGRLYSVNSGVLTCLDAKSDAKIYQSRLTSGAADAADDGPGRGQRGGAPGERGGRAPGGPGGFGRGGGMGGQDYASPVAGDGKLFFITRAGDCHVVKLGETFEKLATNRINEETEDFSATPAISDGALFIRSSKHLYCISEEKKVTEKP